MMPRASFCSSGCGPAGCAPCHPLDCQEKTMSADDYSIINSRGDFHAAVRHAFEQAALIGCREIWLADPDFADWPLGEPALIDHLRAWAQPHRKLTLLAQTFDAVARRHPRWVDWRRTWSHVVECRTNTELEAGQMPTLFLAPGLLALRLVDPLRYRGSVSHDAATLLRTRETLDEVLQRSSVAFPATVLGV
jgi:hypothetical protein